VCWGEEIKRKLHKVQCNIAGGVLEERDKKKIT